MSFGKILTARNWKTVGNDQGPNVLKPVFKGYVHISGSHVNKSVFLGNY